MERRTHRYRAAALHRVWGDADGEAGSANDCESRLFALSWAVMVIVCGPTPTSVPADGLCESVTAPQLSEAIVCGNTLGILA